MSAARADPELLAAITDWVSGALALTDLGYEGEPETFTIPVKKPRRLGGIAAALPLLHREHARTT